MTCSEQSLISWDFHFPSLPEGHRKYPPRMNLCGAVLAGDDDSIALKSGNRSISYRELRNAVTAVADGLSDLGLKPGDRLLILSYNTYECAVAFLSSVYRGLVPVLANSMMRAREIEYVISDSAAKAVFAHEPTVEAVNEAVGDCADIAVLTPASLGSLAAQAAGEAARSVGAWAPLVCDSDEPAFMVYSSGTTGQPKGIVHAHRWIRTMGDPINVRNQYSADDVVLATGEFSFVAALGSGLLHPLRANCAVSLLGERPTPDALLRRIDQHGVTVIYSVPTLYRMMFLREDEATLNTLRKLRFASSAGEALTGPVCRKWEELTGVPMYESYGVSEFQMLVANGQSFPVKAGSVGKSLPGIPVRILDDQNRCVPPNTPGRLAVPVDDLGISLGYNNKRELWDRCFRDGWFVTEDVFTYDEEGYLWHVGRTGDMFKSRGYLIAPSEIEDVIESHPDVAEAAVVGIDDPLIGQQIVAVLVPRTNLSDEEAFVTEIAAYVKGRLAPYKVPAVLKVSGVLPRSPLGKILRSQLRDDLEVS